MFPIRDSITYHGTTIATFGLIGLNVTAFFYQLSFSPAALELIFNSYGFTPVDFFRNPTGQYTTIFSSMFIHGSFSHILGNMWFLWVFGPAVEGRIGFVKFTLLYILSGIAAAFFQAFSMPLSGIPMVGASGAISGVLGAYLVLFFRARILTVIMPFFFLLFWIPAPIYIGYWILLQFTYASMGAPGVAWWAHIGGFVLGLAIILFMSPKRNYKADPFWECWRDYC